MLAVDNASVRLARPHVHTEAGQCSTARIRSRSASPSAYSSRPRSGCSGVKNGAGAGSGPDPLGWRGWDHSHAGTAAAPRRNAATARRAGLPPGVSASPHALRGAGSCHQPHA